VSADLVVEAMRVGWLTLAFMMLLSRVAFQLAGPVRMRSFLDGWQSGAVRRFWGAVALAYAIFLCAAAVPRFGELTALDVVLLVALLLVLLVDGTLNVLPAGFETFKSSLQEAWVRRRRGTGKEGDRYLFGTINALLAAGSAAMAAVVISYRSIETETVAVAAVIAVAATAGLVGASTVEASRGRLARR
jgi:hypothetical protein